MKTIARVISFICLSILVGCSSLYNVSKEPEFEPDEWNVYEIICIDENGYEYTQSYIARERLDEEVEITMCCN